MLHVAEKHVYLHAASTMGVAQTVLVNFDTSRNALSVERGPEKDHIKYERLSVWEESV